MEFPREEELLDQLFKDKAFKKFISTSDYINSIDWNNWFQNKNIYTPVKDEARALYKIRFYEGQVFNGYEIREEVWNKIEAKTIKLSYKKAIPIFSKSFHKWLPYAAIITAVLFAAIWWIYQPNNNIQENYSFASKDKKETFILPDQTKLILNKNSKAIFSLNDSVRILKVYGEGYLEVAKLEFLNQRVPFKVEHGNFVVEVLGTQFNFIGTEKTKSIALFEGKVKVRDQSGELIMKPGDVIKSVNGTLSKLPINSDLFMAWNTGILKLRNTSLTEIMEWITLTQNRTIEIQVSEQILSQTISGEIEISNEMNLFKTLGNLYNLSIVQNGDKLIIREAK